MAENFTYAYRAIMPALLLALLGYIVKRQNWLEKNFFSNLNRLCFRIFVPIQLFCNVYSTTRIDAFNWRFIAFVEASVLVLVLAGLLTARLFLTDSRQVGTVAQAAFRSNQLALGIPIAGALGGEPAVALLAVVTAVTVPLYNVFGVLILMHYNKSARQDNGLRSTLHSICTNPMILGSLIGLAAVAVRAILPQSGGTPVVSLSLMLPSLFKMLTNVSKVGTPLMLFVMGAKLNLQAVRPLIRGLAVGVFLKLILAPALMIGAALLLKEEIRFTVLELSPLVAISASPVSVTSTVVVQEIGGDEQLANQLVMWTSVLSVFTMFITIFLLRAVGVL